MNNANEDEILIPKPITDWIIKILSNLYNDDNLSTYNGVDMKKMIFFDLIHLLQVCKNPANKWNLKFKMKTKKLVSKETGISQLQICVYGPIMLITDDGKVDLFVEIYIPRHGQYKISEPPKVLINFEETLSNNANNETLKYWLKDEIQFKNDSIDTSEWMLMEFKNRNLVNFAQCIQQFCQQSLTNYEHQCKQKSLTPPKIVSPSHDIPDITKKVATLDILDDVNLENELKEKMKQKKEQLITALQDKVDGIHKTVIPDINRRNKKKQDQLQSFIDYYEKELNIYKQKYDIAKDAEEQTINDLSVNSMPFLGDLKPLSKYGVHDIVDTSDVNFESQYENWYIEKKSALDAYKQLYEDLKQGFFKALALDSGEKAPADLIDFEDDSSNSKEFENLKSQLKIVEDLSAKEFDIKFELLAYENKL
ncbi:hypothetical protein ACO0R3_002008 [Hanseniaspora guilliermondii]